MTDRSLLGWMACLLLAGVGCAGPGGSGAAPSPAVVADADAALADAGAASSSGLSAASEALCQSLSGFLARCVPGALVRSCGEVFQHLDRMDPDAQRTATSCLERPCASTSLGTCYAEAAAAVEPDWIDTAELSSCWARAGACAAAPRAELAQCLTNSAACDWPFGISYCWDLATLTRERRRAGVACELVECTTWESCLAAPLFD